MVALIEIFLTIWWKEQQLCHKLMQDWDHYSRLLPTTLGWKQKNFFGYVKMISFYLADFRSICINYELGFPDCSLWWWCGHDFGAPLAASYCVQWHVLGWLDAIKCEMMAVIFVGFLEPPLWFILAWLLGGHAFSFLEYLFSCKSSMMHGEYLVKDHSSCCCCLLMMLPASYLHSYLGFLKCQNTKWNSPKNPHLFLLGHLNR